MLNRLGTHMYWNNSWVHTFNGKDFFNKTLFFENIFLYILSERVFTFFFKNVILRKQTKKEFRFSLLKKNKKSFFTKKFKKGVGKKFFTKKYNFTKMWLLKYNSFILFTTFVFFYFKVKKKKKTKPKKRKTSKVFLLFWRRKKGYRFKKKKFSTKTYIGF
jgi:hypothetical protein